MYSSRRNELQNRSFSLKATISTAAKDVLHQSDNEELPKNPFNYSLEDLQVIEKERRSLLTRVKRFSLMNISTSFYGTVLPDILRSMFSWFNLALYIAIRVVIKTNYLAVGLELPQINTTLVSIVGGFMSFFLVFFVSQAYTRFCLQYDNSMRIEGRMLNLAFFAKNNLEPAEAWRFVRYINAIHVAGYTGLSHIYTEVNIFDTMNNKHKLLTDVETKRVKEIGLNAGGTAYREILGWCYEILYSQFRKHREQFDIISFQTMLQELMTLRGCMGSLYDYDDQPIPFIYIHLVFLMSLFYCPLIAYTAAVYMPAKTVYIFPDILGFFVVFLNMVFVIGLREIGHAMNTPYEDSLQDLSVLHYLDFAVNATRKILAGSSMPTPGIEVEEELESTRPELSLAFQDHSVSVGGPRLNNFHQSQVLLHQHHRPYAANTNLLSPMASTKSASEAIAASQYGVYAPYLAGTIHHSYPSFHPHQANHHPTTNSSNSSSNGIHNNTINGHNSSNNNSSSGHVATSSFTAVHAHHHPHLHPNSSSSNNNNNTISNTSSTLPFLFPVSNPKHTGGDGGGVGNAVTHSHSFTEGLSTQQYIHDNTANEHNNDNVLFKTGDFHSVSHTNRNHTNINNINMNNNHLKMHDAAILTLQEESKRNMQHYAQQALFPSARSGSAMSQQYHPHAHIQTSPSTVSLASLAGDDAIPSDKSEPNHNTNNTNNTNNSSAVLLLTLTPTEKQKSHQEIHADKLADGDDKNNCKASFSMLLRPVDQTVEVVAANKPADVPIDNKNNNTDNNIAVQKSTKTTVVDTSVKKGNNNTDNNNAENQMPATSTSAPPCSSPCFIETRKRRNTKILNSEDSLSLVPEDTSSDHET